MKKLLVSALLAALATSALSGCYVAARPGVYAPAPRVWVPAHWQRDGYTRVWIPGHWRRA